MCNGKFFNKGPKEAFEYFDYLAENAQFWDVSDLYDRSENQKCVGGGGKYHLKEFDDLHAKLALMSKKLESLELKKVNEMHVLPSIEKCNICEDPGHVINACPTIPAFKEVLLDQSNPVRMISKNFSGPYSNTYNAGWRSHPNFSWKNEQPEPSTQGQSQYTPYGATAQGSGPSYFANQPPPMQRKGVEDSIQQLTVRINIPLLDAIKPISAYAKFLKDLCTAKRKLNVQKKAFLTEQVSAIIQNHTPPKYKDPGSPTISCVIGNSKIGQALLDLGSGVNLLPYSVYEQLGLGELKATSIILQVADRSIKIPKGIVEDVLVQVDKFYYPIDFVVLDMQLSSHSNSSPPVILGRPFPTTSNAIINCRSGVLKLSFGNMTLELNIFNLCRQPQELEDVEEVNALESLLAENSLLNYNCDELWEDLEDSLDLIDSTNQFSSLCAAGNSNEMQWKPKFEPLPALQASTQPSNEKTPMLKLKPLPSELKYAYLGLEKSFPVVIYALLTPDQESKLLKILAQHKSAIGWSIGDIKGISPFICTHRIYLEEDSKPSKEMQRRLNPTMKEVVKNEVLKLLDIGIIYPIADSKWVSPIQVVPKKSDITMVENDKGKFVPTRETTGWRMCVDYRKLNTASRKDHFPLYFLDQILEKVAGHKYYCFLDGFFGYYQIERAPEDQEKTTFTCPFGTFAFKRMSFGLCNAPATFQICMLSIFSDLIEDIVEVFMDDFSVFGKTFDACLSNL
ncbi:uncharacterized protein LOC122293734 [Carya illinoinensis]|uniref:uncharacterized protein LOC122293734 n=1 Tax=Carya illinoinensis TaxID=32201 RepID=UPI001C72045B|nr:uncharacterized protein LOC122293734 [Carya illinoinensis]